MYYRHGGYAWIGALGAGYLLLLAIIAIFFVFCYWKIFAKAGYPGILSLIALIPLFNLVLLIWFAFADWPVLRRARGERID